LKPFLYAAMLDVMICYQIICRRRTTNLVAIILKKFQQSYDLGCSRKSRFVSFSLNISPFDAPGIYLDRFHHYLKDEIERFKIQRESMVCPDSGGAESNLWDLV
jgi:hypothetical protein